MPLTINEESKNEYLHDMLEEDEKYIGKTWATIARYTPILKTYSLTSTVNIGFSNIYCYVGISKKNIHIVTLHAADVTRITGRFTIPLSDIQSVDIKQGLLKSSALLHFQNEQIKINWILSSTGTSIKNQKQYVKKTCDYLQSIQ